ncbi:MAG: hypothetical protein ABIR34_05125 [Marmoricola sp.]
MPAKVMPTEMDRKHKATILVRNAFGASLGDITASNLVALFKGLLTVVHEDAAPTRWRSRLGSRAHHTAR